MFHKILSSVLLVIAVGIRLASAQTTIPPPVNQLIVCGTQNLPAATSYTVSVDGGAFVAMTLDTTKASICTAVTQTSSFRLAAALFPPSNTPHTIVVRATNAFGSTTAAAYSVLIGTAPGQYIISAAVPN